MLEWLWSWLPDKCQAPHCSRKGIRGNENMIGGIIMEFCHIGWFVAGGLIGWFILHPLIFGKVE